ncbi:MAG TPA: hypothetical protein VIE67_02350 [Rudaea sp.]|jgi:hypothetical protein|uniref:hypothetical protein n=1 Tax=Rudaea sp. TaxID=2136325 RepID=UPI002F92F893
MNDPDKNSFDQAAWIAQARQLLDESARDLDAHTASRLNRARQTALALQSVRSPRRWLLPAGLASACAALLLAVAIWQPHHSALSPAPDTLDSAATTAGAVGTADADTSPADDTLEFYQNLEFYAWLDAQGKDGDG